jgi:hypothetical protein
MTLLENKSCELKRVKVFFIGVSDTDPSWASEEPPSFLIILSRNPSNVLSPEFNAQPEKPSQTKPACTKEIYVSATQNALALLASEAPANVASALKSPFSYNKTASNFLPKHAQH